MKDTEYFRKNGWHQGNIIDDEATVHVLLENSYWYKLPDCKSPAFLIVISHDCDILNNKLEDEPYIDLLSGFFENRDGNFFYGKNPRRLQIEFGEKIIGLNANETIRVTKDLFEALNPKHSSMTLNKNDIKHIVNWISRRYSRAAFPDEFNNRLKVSNQQIDKTTKNPLMNNVSLIFVDISNEELKTEDEYEITMIIGVQHGLNLKIMSQVEDLFFDTFNIAGIKADVEVYDEYDITYEVISTYKRFNWDFRSYQENLDVAVPVDGIDTI